MLAIIRHHVPTYRCFRFMSSPRYPIVFTDLDGTLLNHSNYSYSNATTALAELSRRKIPVIFNTSKTLEESVTLAETMALHHPVIIEHGGAIVIPPYYSFGVSDTRHLNWQDGHRLLTLGASLAQIHKQIDEASRSLECGDDYEMFSSMALQRIQELTGLSRSEAQLAKRRRFSEPLHWVASSENLSRFQHFINVKGLEITQGGRFHHVIGKSNKRTAMEHLAGMYNFGANNSTKPFIIALGDSENDLEMLSGADIAVVVKNNARHTLAFEHDHAIRTNEEGPAGWREAIEKILAHLDSH